MKIQQSFNLKTDNLIPLIDSRKVINPSQSLFFAIKGVQNDGHNYISDLYKKGVRNFVIEAKDFEKSDYPDATFC